MADLVTRLRAHMNPMMNEAADEIERLYRIAVDAEHEEDCAFRNLSGDLECDCAFGRAVAFCEKEIARG